MKPSVRFTSVLAQTYRDRLERIVYFNEQQHKVRGPLLDAIHRYGSPKVIVSEGLLRFAVPAFAEVQSLYALDEIADPPTLAAAVIYTRESVETLVVLYLAIHEDYAAGGAHAEEMLGAQIIELLRANAARTKGIRWLRLLYPKDIRISVRAG